MLTVERPSAFIMTLSFVAQSLVVTIVGINMGFRKDNTTGLWRKWWKTRMSKSIAVVQNLNFDSRAYE